MIRKGLRLPTIGAMRERVVFVDSSIRPSNALDEKSLFETHQLKSVWAAVQFVTPLSTYGANNETIQQGYDAVVNVRLNPDLRVDTNFGVYYPYRKFGEKVDYWLNVVMLHEQHRSFGFLTVLCKTTQVFDARLVNSSRETPIFTPADRAFNALPSEFMID